MNRATPFLFCFALALIPASAIAGRWSSVEQKDGGAFSGWVVEETNAVAASPRAILNSERGIFFHNRLATVETHIDLPEAKAGRLARFSVRDVDGIQVNCKSGDVLRIAGTQSASGGFVSSTTQGDYLVLVAVNSSTWVAMNPIQGWTFDT